MDLGVRSWGLIERRSGEFLSRTAGVVFPSVTGLSLSSPGGVVKHIVGVEVGLLAMAAGLETHGPLSLGSNG